MRMAEITNESKLNRIRFQQNREQADTGREDEDIIDELVDFMMAISEEVTSPTLQSIVRDQANVFLNNRSELAKGRTQPEEEVLPEQQVPLPPPGLEAPGGGVPVAPQQF